MAIPLRPKRLTAGPVRPIGLFGALKRTMPYPLFPGPALPSGPKPMKLPCTLLPLEVPERLWMKMPADSLPEITFPAPAVDPPIRLPDAFWMKIPSC